ncbi:ATP-binding cassette domain-containing protein [Paenibacillus sp. MMS18-CY102]|nr:ATP-binding cassette domain-containing protein [Paenibacillus sp. MMS18-CY102]
MIEVSSLSKAYKIVKKKPGLSGAIKGLISREYTIKQAVNDISFTIQQGETVGYIGANGAGKSTTIKMLCGILHPTSGEVKINGRVPYASRKENARKIGAVFGQRTQLFWDIAVKESYDLLKHIYRIPDQEYEANLAYFTEKLQLEGLLDIPVRQLSLGQKMRCELAAAFLHSPSIVFLDEPTIGLDVSVKNHIRAFIKEMNETKKTTILLTTHDMQDIEEICNRIIIIDEGSILYDGDLASIKRNFGHKRVIQFEVDAYDTLAFPVSMQEKIEVVENKSANAITVTFKQDEIASSEIVGYMMNHYQVRDLTVNEVKIETIVKEIYERGV